jgi:hypothetical protein
VSSSHWLSTVSISRSILASCGTTDIEQPMICIRLYREGGRYMESANHSQKKEKKKKEEEYKKRKKDKENEKTHV